MDFRKASGRLVKAPENFIDPAGVRKVFSEAKEGRRDFIRGAFAAAAGAAGVAAARAATPADGDPAILDLPEHSKGLGQPVVTDGYGKPSKWERNVQRRQSPGLTQTRQANVEQARGVIDDILMLREKTRGNLEPDEEAHLADVIVNLERHMAALSGRPGRPKGTKLP